MNWNGIFKLAVALFAVQAVIGFLDGVLSPAGAGTTWFVAINAISFVVCGALFAIFAKRQPTRPFASAWIALLIQVGLALVLSLAISRWLGSTPWLLVALEWLVLGCSLLVGTSIGSILRHRTGRTAEA